MFLKKIHNLRKSLLFRLTILYAVAFTFLSSIGFLIFYYRIYSVTMERLDLELLEESEKYATLMMEKGLEGVRSAIAEEAESENPHEEFHRLFNTNGNILATTDMSSWGSVDTQGILSKLHNAGPTYVTQTITIPERDYKARIISAIVGPDTVLQIGEILEGMAEYLKIFRNLFSILIISLIIVSAVIGWFLAKRALIDMAEVTETAEEISKGSYDRRVQIKGRFKEIERLGATFNRMLDRIQSLLKSMKEINDNIAHDLRSPLARIRGIAEMSLLKEKSIDAYQDMAASTMEECDILIDMINTMLDITEVEAGVNEVKTEEFELVALILEACELFRPIAEEKKIDLKTNLPESLTLKNDRKKMQRIMTNILENAIKYTPEDGMVSISAAAQDGEVRIDFKDTGMGISENDLPHIFERFYRCDRSRSQGGVGLGLSLVKAYIESMNGTIRVWSTINQGSLFALKFAL
jgi:signal transduction histidine kinase